MGGALRFLHEVDGYVARRPEGIRLLGRGRRVSGPWLGQREWLAGRCDHTVALNNLCFVVAGRFKTVLLRNALHFLSAEERTRVDVSRAVAGQGAVVQAFLRKADRIVVPTSSMAARVITARPTVASRICVLPHPVSPPPGREREPVVLCPVLDAPYKMLGPRLTAIINAMELVRKDDTGITPDLLVTLTDDEAARLEIPHPKWLRLLGRLSPAQLHATQQSARVIVYPTVLESFGYPLAEARLARQPVVAPETDHAREVAGDALVPYDPSSLDSLMTALKDALGLQLDPLPRNPFDPDAYFQRLLSPG